MSEYFFQQILEKPQSDLMQRPSVLLLNMQIIGKYEQNEDLESMLEKKLTVRTRV